MMLCSRCGTEIQNGEKFCKGCGSQILMPQNNIQINSNIQQVNNQQMYNNQMNLTSNQNITNNLNNTKNKKIKWYIPILIFILGIVLKVISLTIQNLDMQTPESNLLNIIGTLLWVLSIISVPVVIILKTSDDKSVYVKTDNSTITDDDLIKIFIGRNYKKIYSKLENPKKINKSFNIFAFLLGPFYYVYRKMYLISILLFISIALLFSILPFLSNGVVSGIIWGVLFIPLYKWHINKKINTFKTKINNSNELWNICKTKGGTLLNKTGLIITFISIPILVIVATAIMLSNANKTYETDTYKYEYNSLLWIQANDKQKVFDNESCNSSLLIYLSPKKDDIGVFCNYNYNSIDKGLYSLEQLSTRQELENSFIEGLTKNDSTITITNKTSIEKLENNNYVMYVDYKNSDTYSRIYVLFKEESQTIKLLIFKTLSETEKTNETINKNAYEIIKSVIIK